MSALPFAYVLAAQPCFESLRDGLVQLAGFCLFRATRPAGSRLDISPLDKAREAIAAPIDEIEGLRVPANAAHHYYHLRSAGAALQRALDAAYSTRSDGDDAMFAAVEDAERHIRAAGRLLPGFEVVDLRQGCCAMHAVAGNETFGAQLRP